MSRKKKEKVDSSIEVIEDTEEDIIKALEDTFTPHDGQKKVDKYIFEDGRKRGFVQWGRDAGKSVGSSYLTCKNALIKKSTKNYIVLPEKTQGMEVMWASGNLRDRIPRKYIKDSSLGNRKAVIKNELRIELWNGSFIKLLGADDPDSLRGIKPDWCVYDEYRDFKSDVYWIMEANLLAKGCVLLICSTPPDVTGHYSELREFFIEESKKKNSNYFYLEMPTHINPHMDKDELEAIKRRLYSHGQARTWEREYLAKFIPGGAASIFPMFTDKKEDIVRPHHLLMELINNKKDEWEFWAMFDPATSSTFGALFVAYNRFRGQVITLDEIYERDRTKTSPIDIWDTANGIKREFLPDLGRWENVYDEHESWFYNALERHEILLPSEVVVPTQKQSRNIEEDLSIIKDLMLLENKYFISDRCKNLIEEYESYHTDKTGKIVRKKNHLIDCKRYFIAAADLTINERPNYEVYLEQVKNRARVVPGFEKFMQERNKAEDWTSDLNEDGMLTGGLEELDYDEFSFFQ